MSTHFELPLKLGKAGMVLAVAPGENGYIWVPQTGTGSVVSVTGLNTDNTNPANPVVKISVDGTTITGLGTPASPLVAAVTPVSGNLTTTTTGVTIAGGTGAVLGTGTTVNIATATTGTTGLLTSTDWNTFNGKFNTPGGTTAQYIRGDGSLATFPTPSSAYATIEDGGTALTQRTVLNFVDYFTLTDAASKTNVSINTTELGGDTTLATTLGNNTTFITALTSNSTFQTDVNNFVTAGNVVQNKIQFQDEGTNLGTSGTVSTVNFTGNGVTATRASNTITVNVSPVGGGSSFITSIVGFFAMPVTATTINIPHGLGFTPSKMRITWYHNPGVNTSSVGLRSEGFVDFSTSTNKSFYAYYDNAGTGNYVNQTSSIYCLYYEQIGSGNPAVGFSATANSTNIVLTSSSGFVATGLDIYYIIDLFA